MRLTVDVIADANLAIFNKVHGICSSRSGIGWAGSCNLICRSDNERVRLNRSTRSGRRNVLGDGDGGGDGGGGSGSEVGFMTLNSYDSVTGKPESKVISEHALHM